MLIDFHELANIYPMMRQKDFEQLTADIQENGLKKPIVLFENKILDGRNRYNACLRLGIEPTFIEYDGDTSVSVIVKTLASENLHRRHLTTSQWAMVALSIEQILAEEMKKADAQRRSEAFDEQQKDNNDSVGHVARVPHDPNESSKSKGVSGRASKEASQAVGGQASGRNIRNAKKLAREAPDLAEEVHQGTRSMRSALEELKARQSEGPNESLEWTETELSRKEAVEQGKSVVANMKTDNALVAWATERDLFVKIDRKTIWGNPYLINQDGTRHQVRAKYEIYFEHKTSLHKRHEDIKGKVLGCWCYPEPCHGDFLVQIAALDTIEKEPIYDDPDFEEDEAPF